MKREGHKIMTPEEAAARELFDQRTQAAQLAIMGAGLVRQP